LSLSSPPFTRPACAALSKPCECANPPVGSKGSINCQVAQSANAASEDSGDASEYSRSRFFPRVMAYHRRAR
jgi:hypothetical protein